jgi:hypothetical protein
VRVVVALAAAAFDFHHFAGRTASASYLRIYPVLRLIQHGFGRIKFAFSERTPF